MMINTLQTIASEGSLRGMGFQIAKMEDTAVRGSTDSPHSAVNPESSALLNRFKDPVEHQAGQKLDPKVHVNRLVF